MADPLTEFIKPGFPKESFSSSGYSTIIEYIGPKDDLYGVASLGQPWGDYRGIVEDAQGDPIEGTLGYANLTIRMLAKFGDNEQPATAQGEPGETTYEIDWVNVPKSLLDHPKFIAGGTYALDDSDRIQIAKWEEMWDETEKLAYKFYPFNTADYVAGAATDTLSTNASKYADGRLLGVETFNAKTPVLRKSTFYRNGVPPTGTDVGEKDTPPAFPGMPDGYEWVKEADRSTNTGKQNEWRRDEEWIGAEKVLVDSKNIYF